jgi:hypothetical protein
MTNTKLLKEISNIRTMDEINQAIRAIKAQRNVVVAQDAAIKKATLCVGQQVRVNGSKNVNEIGVIEKIKIKNAVVRIDGQLWNCPLSILECA